MKKARQSRKGVIAEFVGTEEEKKEYRRKYRAKKTMERFIKKKSLGGSHSVEQWDEVRRKQNHQCLFCKKVESSTLKLTVDHIIPIFLWNDFWGSLKPPYQCNDIENIQALCGSCNSKKGITLDKNLKNTLSTI